VPDPGKAIRVIPDAGAAEPIGAGAASFGRSIVRLVNRAAARRTAVVGQRAISVARDSRTTVTRI
jgi:hypothetical protein